MSLYVGSCMGAWTRGGKTFPRPVWWPCRACGAREVSFIGVNLPMVSLSHALANQTLGLTLELWARLVLSYSFSKQAITEQLPLRGGSKLRQRNVSLAKPGTSGASGVMTGRIPFPNIQCASS